MKKLSIFLLCSLMLSSTLLLASCKDNSDGTKNPPEAEGSQGLEYELMTGLVSYYAVTGIGTCTDTVVVIPKTYNGIAVSAIADRAFSTKTTPLASADDTKTNEAQKLSAEMETTTSFDDATVIPTDTAEMKITEVVIPSSVTEIGNEAFYGCASLSTVKSSDLINLIGTDAFKDTAFYLDEANWNDGVLYLDNYLVEVRDSFSGVLNVKEGTVNIATDAARDNTAITELILPSTLRVIGRNAFFGCTGLQTLDLSIPGISIEASAFQNCSSLTEVKIGTDDAPSEGEGLSLSGLAGLGFVKPGSDSNQFLDQFMKRTDEVFMPQGLAFAIYGVAEAETDRVYSASVGNSAFNGCTSLSSVSFGKNVGVIGSGAFWGCSSLVSVDLSPITAHTPETPVNAVGATYYRHMDLANVFRDCTALKNVILPKNIQYLNGTFEGCTALESFVVPDTVKGLKNTFSYCSSLKSVTLSKELVAIYGTFKACVALESVELPETLTKIGKHSFAGCTALQNVQIPDSVTELDENAFAPLSEDKKDPSSKV